VVQCLLNSTAWISSHDLAQKGSFHSSSRRVFNFTYFFKIICRNL
jgi:hypothetical protein